MAQLQTSKGERSRKGRARVASPRSKNRIPALENGDHLTRAEFERRYEAMSQLKKAELIEGIVYMGSPVRAREHGTPHFNTIAWLSIYSVETAGVMGGDNTTIRLDMDNEPQPDAFLLIDQAVGGRAGIDLEGYVAGAPELVVEIAASSASYDLHEKLAVYRRNGVQEYITWRVQDDAIDWRVLREGVYVSLEPDEEGLLHSQVFPGLTLDPAALISGNMSRVVKVQRAALKSTEYKKFAGDLTHKMSGKKL